MGNLFGLFEPNIELPTYQKLRVGDFWNPRPRKENPMFLHEESSDVLIFVKNSPHGDDAPTWSRYPCHRTELKRHVPELERCIHSESLSVPSQKNPEVMEFVLKNVIDIDEHKPEVVEDVLRYIYERYIQFEDWKNARDVLIMANMYKMNDLSEECEKFLLGSMRLRNACYLLQLAFECQQNNLQETCLKFCTDTAFVVLKTKGFYEASREAVQKLTSRDDINIENELTLFSALWEWSKTKCIQEKTPLTVDNINETFAEHVANCVRFEAMDDEQKHALPEYIRYRFRKRLSKNREENNKEKKNINKIRCMKFVEFNPISAILMFEYKPLKYRDYRVGDKVTCIRFSINVDSYLLEICTMCEIQAQVAHIKRLQVVGEKGVEFEFDSSFTSDMLFLNLSVKQLILEANSVATVTQFRPIHMLLLSAGTYSIEIEPQNRSIKWPVTQAKVNRKYSDVVVNLLGETCGLAKVELLQAY